MEICECSEKRPTLLDEGVPHTALPYPTAEGTDIATLTDNLLLATGY